MVPDFPAALSAAGGVMAALPVFYALNHVRKSHELVRTSETKRNNNDEEGEERDLRKAAEILDLANLIPPWAFRFLVVGICAQVLAGIFILIKWLFW